MQIGPVGGGSSSATFKGAAAYMSGSQAYGTPNVSVVLTLDTQSYDVGACWSTGAATRMIAPVAGYYLVQAAVTWASATDATTREIRIRLNAAGVAGAGTSVALMSTPAIATAGVSTTQRCSAVIYMAAGDYVEAFGLQNSAGSLNASMAVGQAFSIALLGT